MKNTLDKHKRSDIETSSLAYEVIKKREREVTRANSRSFLLQVNKTFNYSVFTKEKFSEVNNKDKKEVK